jgi:hypothetical protein
MWGAPAALPSPPETGCAGVVLGRGCLGRPWLFRDLADAYAGRPVLPSPALGQVVAVMRRHVRLLVDLHGDELRGVTDFRKHVGWYLTGYPAGAERRRRMAQASSLAELDGLLEQLDPTVRLRAEDENLPRGHLQGPRPVTLPEGWLDRPEDPTPPAGGDVLASGG